jgi:hypothetical protein
MHISNSSFSILTISRNAVTEVATRRREYLILASGGAMVLPFTGAELQEVP